MSDAPSKIKLFESHHVRAEWDAEHEKWWFSVLDTIAILTDQPDYKKVRNYWKWLKNKLNAEGSQLVSATNQLKLVAADGKRYKTDVLDTEQVLRLIQSIPSPKAEPFKLWLAQVGSERLDETATPSCPSTARCRTTSAWATASSGSTSALNPLKCAKHSPTNGTRPACKKAGNMPP